MVGCACTCAVRAVEGGGGRMCVAGWRAAVKWGFARVGNVVCCQGGVCHHRMHSHVACGLVNEMTDTALFLGTCIRTTPCCMLGVSLRATDTARSCPRAHGCARIMAPTAPTTNRDRSTACCVLSGIAAGKSGVADRVRETGLDAHAHVRLRRWREEGG